MVEKCDLTQIYNFNFIRGLLLLFNVLLWVCGLLIVLAAVWLQTDFINYLRISTKYSPLAPQILIAMGCIILFTAALACSCIIKVDHTMLVVYGGFLIATMFTLIFLSIYIYTYKNHVIGGIPKGIEVEMIAHKENDMKLNGTLIDFVQNKVLHLAHSIFYCIYNSKLHCCGNESHLDWLGKSLPRSCCRNVDSAEKCNKSKIELLHQVGCRPKLIRLINSNLTNVGIMLSVIALFPLFAMVFAFSLAALSTKMRFSYERIV